MESLSRHITCPHTDDGTTCPTCQRWKEEFDADQVAADAHEHQIYLATRHGFHRLADGELEVALALVAYHVIENGEARCPFKVVALEIERHR